MKRKILFGILGFLFVGSLSLLILPSLFPGQAAVGIEDGRLKPCPDKPNCVCSENKAADSYIAPLSIHGSIHEAWTSAKQAIRELGGKFEKEGDGYLWATFRTRILRFTDDVELRMDEESRVIHVRSASRLGHSDLGVNKKRIESLRSRFE